MKKTTIRQKVRKKEKKQKEERELMENRLANLAQPHLPFHFVNGFDFTPEIRIHHRKGSYHDPSHRRYMRERFHDRPYIRHHYGDFSDFMSDEDDDDQPPMTEELRLLMSQVSNDQQYYVYDVYNYQTKLNINPKMKLDTENTLRIGVIAPMIFASRQQNDDILQWAQKVSLLPPKWDSKDVIQSQLTEHMIACVEITDTFVQYLLRLEALNLVKVSYHIGEWYNFSKMHANHRMRSHYKLDRLKVDLNKMMLLPSVNLIYADQPSELVWNIAVFVCHQYFFYLADSEYKRHKFLDRIKTENNSKEAKRLRELGNELHKDMKYLDAIKSYGEALSESPCNHLVYSNRAMAYLKLRETPEYAASTSKAAKCAYSAMSDAFRCIKLEPLYAKGHVRYATALVALDKTEAAVKALKAAILNFHNNNLADDVKSLERRLAQYAPNEVSPAQTLTAGNDKIKTKPGKVGKLDKEDKSKDLRLPFGDDIFRDNIREKLLKPPDSIEKQLEELAAYGRKLGANPTVTIKTEFSLGSPPGHHASNILQTSKTSSKSSADSKVKESKSAPSKSSSMVQAQKSKESALSMEEIIAEAERVMNIKNDLMASLKKGSEALLSQKYRFAINLYDKCFGIIHAHKAAALNQTASDVMVLRYARALAFTSVGPSEDIVTGVKEFRVILEHQPSQTMKAITLYELGVTCSKQHRYKEALDNIEESLKICQNRKGLRNTYYWPGTTTFIQHSDVTVLKEKLCSLRYACQHPPLPDYICCAEIKICSSYGHDSSHIYINDPNFKGFVYVLCSEKCILHYHRECFKKKHIKVQNNCITPDCEGFICRYTEYDEHNEKFQEEKSDRSLMKANTKEKKPVFKQPVSNPVRIAKKKLRKELKKELRSKNKEEPVGEESKEESLADRLLAADVGNATAAASAAVESSPQPDIRTSNFVIKHKKKEEAEELQQQASRKQTKKVKNKQTMSLEEFCGPIEDAESFSSGSYGLESSHFMSSGQLRGAAEVYQPDALPVVIQGVRVEQLSNSVKGFYSELLRSRGPLRVDSEEIKGYLEYEVAAKELVQYSGGLASFLLSTGEFAMLENLICVKSDIVKAQQMIGSVRSTAHGVSVVPHDFKEHMERASAYVPERKLLSAYEDVEENPRIVDAQKWRSVVDQWNGMPEDCLSDGRERSASISDTFSEVDFEAEKVTSAPATKVETISPDLMKAWKETLDQKLMTSANNLYDERSAVSTNIPSINSDTSSIPSMPRDNTFDNVDVTGNVEPPAESLVSAESPNVNDVSNNTSPSAGYNNLSGVTASPALCDDSFMPYLPAPSTSALPVHNSSSLYPQIFSPSLPAYNHNMSPYTGPSLVHQLNSVPALHVPSTPVPAPIGTPSPSLSSTSSSTSVIGSSRLPNFKLGYDSQSTSYNTWMTGGSSITQPTEWLNVRSITGHPKTASVSVQTDNILVDKECNTVYESMSDYDKLNQKYSMEAAKSDSLSDKLMQLKQSSNAELQELTRKLNDALQNEKATRDKCDQTSITCEKETRKWKDEKKTATDEINNLKQANTELRHRLEEKDSLVRELQSKVQSLQQRCDEEVNKREAMVRQHQASVEALEKRVMTTELEVIDEREKFALSRCKEALDNTNKSIEQQRAHLERMSQVNQSVPPIVHKNVQLANTRRQKLMSLLDEQMAIYESQREAVRSGTIPLSSLPKISPPSLMEVFASTSLPHPPRPPMPLAMMGPQGLHPNVRPPFPGAPRMVVPDQMAVRAGALQPPNSMLTQPPVTSVSSQSAATVSDQREPARPATPVKDQSGRRLAAEQHLIQQVQDVFPQLTSDDVKSYISKLRQSRNSLTGLKLIELVQLLIELISSELAGSNSQVGNVGQANPVAEDCTICHEKMMSGNTRRMSCGHHFHEHCIQNWLMRQNTCPVCRTEF